VQNRSKLTAKRKLTSAPRGTEGNPPQLHPGTTALPPRKPLAARCRCAAPPSPPPATRTGVLPWKQRLILCCHRRSSDQHRLLPGNTQPRWGRGCGRPRRWQRGPKDLTAAAASCSRCGAALQPPTGTGTPAPALPRAPAGSSTGSTPAPSRACSGQGRLEAAARPGVTQPQQVCVCTQSPLRRKWPTSSRPTQLTTPNAPEYSEQLASPHLPPPVLSVIYRLLSNPGICNLAQRTGTN